MGGVRIGDARETLSDSPRRHRHDLSRRRAKELYLTCSSSSNRTCAPEASSPATTPIVGVRLRNTAEVRARIAELQLKPSNDCRQNATASDIQ